MQEVSPFFSIGSHPDGQETSVAEIHSPSLYKKLGIKEREKEIIKMIVICFFKFTISVYGNKKVKGPQSNCHLPGLWSQYFLTTLLYIPHLPL